MLLHSFASPRARVSAAAAALAVCLATPAFAQQAAAVANTADPAAAAPAAGQAPPEAKPKPTGFFGSFELGGLLDGYYDYYTTKPDGDASYRNFDTRYNKPRLSMGQIWLVKAPTDDSRAGMNVKLNFGHAATLINAAEPGTTNLKYVEQAFASVLLPIGKGLQVDAGKYVTQHGAEVIEAKDNWNYSRSLLFALAIPYYHTGVRATYNVNDKLALMGNVVEGWNAVSNHNGLRTVGFQATVKPTGAVTLVENFMTGPEQLHDTTDRRNLFDSIATITASKMVSVMANYDYGKDTSAGVPVSWYGLAGYLKIQATSRVAIVPRLEFFKDPDGFMTGTKQTLKEGTITGEVGLAPGLLARLEYRRDVSDVASFATGSGIPASSQGSFGIGVLYTLTSKH
jgi:hypothetical protein